MIAPKEILVTIDDQPCTGVEGQTILEIARANGIKIPTLCYLKELSPWGGCRLCIVEVVGNPKVVPACSTPAANDSAVVTNSERLQTLRRQTLELLFSERNHVCPICPANKGDCGLQHQGYAHGIDVVRYPYLHPQLPTDLSGRYFGIDHNRCILCTRCVRTCDEQEGVHSLDIAHRGEKNRVVVDLNASFGTSSTCTRCGACVANCPTGALFDKDSFYLGQLTKSETVRTTCLECPVGCGLLVYRRDGRILSVRGDAESPVNRGHLCVRGRYETWATARERIAQPLLRKKNALVPVSWDEAMEAIQLAWRAAGHDRRAILASPRLTNETLAALPPLGRVAVRVARHEEAFYGTATPTADALDKLHDADAIIVLGAQPTRDNPVVAARIRTTTRKRGARLLMLHTRKSDLDAYASLVAHEVGLEHLFWDRVAKQLAGAKRPVLVYGPRAMTSIGVSVLDRLIQIFETQGSGGELTLVALPGTTNAATAARQGIELREEIGPWLDERALECLTILASDEPDGGARWLREKHLIELLHEIKFVAVVTAYRSPLIEHAAVVLPAAVWSEKAGTVTNFEGRQLRVEPVVRPRDGVRDDAAILEEIKA